MTRFKVLFGLATLAAGAGNAVIYECGSLDNPYVTYSVHVSDDLVTLRTSHSSKQGLHSMTNMIMKPVADDYSAYQSAGLRVRFAANGVTLSNRYGQRAECH